MTLAKVYGKAVKAFVDGDIDFLSDTIKCALLEDTYTPDQDAHDFWDDCSGDEVSGTGYTAGGATLASKTSTYAGAGNTVTLDAADPEWTTATLSNVRYAVFYKDTGSAATSPLISYMDFETNQSVDAANFSIALSANGIVQFVVG